MKHALCALPRWAALPATRQGVQALLAVVDRVVWVVAVLPYGLGLRLRVKDVDSPALPAR
jgi:hypothetical protein